MRIRLGIPQTIFADLFVSAFPKEFFSVTQLSNTELLNFLASGQIDLALIPSLEIINEENIFVSKNFGISFDGPLSDDYLYFPKNEKNLSKVALAGTVSLNEVILSKVIFRENYFFEIEQKVLSSLKDAEDSTLIASGDINFANGNFSHGDSFAEYVAEFIDAPYLKFVLVSLSKENIEFVNNNLVRVEEQLMLSVKSLLMKKGFPDEAIIFFLDNLDSVYFELTEIEIEGYEDLRKVPFYYGLTDEIKEITFV